MRGVKSVAVLYSALLICVGCAEDGASARPDTMDAAIGGQDGAAPGAPPAGQSGDGGTSPGGDAGAEAAGSLTVEFTTISYGGEYAPRNYGAVWIEDSSGMFVKTMQRWAADIHAGDLAAWTTVSGGWGFELLGWNNPGDMVDAVSTATLLTHESHTVSWNLKDDNQQVVPDGSYFLVVEMTESRAADVHGPVMKVEFTKGPEPQTIERPTDEAFEDVLVSYEP